MVVTSREVSRTSVICLLKRSTLYVTDAVRRAQLFAREQDELLPVTREITSSRHAGSTRVTGNPTDHPPSMLRMKAACWLDGRPHLVWTALAGLEVAEPPGELLRPRLAAVVHSVDDGLVHVVDREGAQGRVVLRRPAVVGDGENPVEDVVLLLRPQLLRQLPARRAEVGRLHHVVHHVLVGLAGHVPPPPLRLEAALQDHLAVPLHLPLVPREAAQAGLERGGVLVGALSLHREEVDELPSEEAVDVFDVVRPPQARKHRQAADVVVEAVFCGQRPTHRYRLPRVPLGHAVVDGGGDEEVDGLTLFDHRDFGTKRAGQTVGAEVGILVNVAQVAHVTLGASHRPGAELPHLLQACVDGFDDVLRGDVHLLVVRVVDYVLDGAPGLEEGHGVNHGEVDGAGGERGAVGQGDGQQSLDTGTCPPLSGPVDHLHSGVHGTDNVGLPPGLISGRKHP
ncbi:hypothetical protein EYF80_022460 [Liparis tanakae]|uniref:Uncharacterized protein n=1 Tax=Liparis tanakae TaxID=230148 RepID=A0A4Z2HQS9_9TELE|nr:hypothetical protein EYF80_022460 [Liparis tanakae]